MTSQEVQERRHSSSCFKCGGCRHTRICRDKRYICNPMKSPVHREIAVVQGKTGQSISRDIGPEKVGQVAAAEDNSLSRILTAISQERSFLVACFCTDIARVVAALQKGGECPSA